MSVEQIEVTSPLYNRSWQPVQGPEVTTLVSSLPLDSEAKENLYAETGQILALCGDPKSEVNNETGLVFGYVQSGKTLSFTSLTAMAKDNEFQIIIVIAGVTTNLVDQSHTRLEKDLRINHRNDFQWRSFKNPKVQDRKTIQDILSNWKDETFPTEDRKTVLITVMKQRNHLSNLCDLLRLLELCAVPTIIIDDEADQASLNTRARKNSRKNLNETSTIYRSILELKQAIPNHTFIQYTATPQAPLFIDIMDELCPSFLQLLTPGDRYTGGNTFFSDNSPYVCTINDITPNIPPSSPPASLLNAMRLFFLGVAQGKAKRNESRNRTMMIHPSQRTASQEDYRHWVSTIITSWIDTLILTNENLDKIDLLQEFELSYHELATTVDDLLPFNHLASRLVHVVKQTEIKILNTRNGNNTHINFNSNYSFILIGGAAMDRGFTVEGLTITYMPRSIGVGNTDTLQQRARFFGYKRDYLGYCRVFIDQEARTAYENYILSEDDMRRRLQQHNMTGRHLDEWPREVFLDRALQLTRTNIISGTFERDRISGWINIESPHLPDINIEHNRQVVNDFLSDLNLTIAENTTYSTIQLPLSALLENLLVKLRYNSTTDADIYTSILYIIERYLELNSDDSCTFYLMSTFDKPRTRSLKDDRISQLFQGRNKRSAGDRSLIDPNGGIAVQLHILDLISTSFARVPTLGVYIPDSIAQDIIRLI